MKLHATRSMFILACAALLLAACDGTPEPTSTPPPPAPPPTSAAAAPAALTPTVKFTLVTGGGTNTLVFVGVGGAIDKQVNPVLQVQPGDVVEITLVNGDGVMHDLAIDELQVASGSVDLQGQIKTVTFRVDQEAPLHRPSPAPAGGMFITSRRRACLQVAAGSRSSTTRPISPRRSVRVVPRTCASI
jgi:FtsP/CotA-like multicopper oxidase with cupredoxin domain